MFYITPFVQSDYYCGLEALAIRRKLGMRDGSSLDVHWSTTRQSFRVHESFARWFFKPYEVDVQFCVEIDQLPRGSVRDAPWWSRDKDVRLKLTRKQAVELFYQFREKKT